MSKYLLLFLIFFIACSNNGSETYSDTISRYSVSQVKDSLVIGQLNYKESKVFDKNDRLITKKVFDKSGSLKGSEKLNYNNDKATSRIQISR